LPASSRGPLGGGSDADATWSVRVALTPREDEKGELDRVLRLLSVWLGRSVLANLRGCSPGDRGTGGGAMATPAGSSAVEGSATRAGLEGDGSASPEGAAGVAGSPDARGPGWEEGLRGGGACD
jgi:hypothetical protein